METDFLIHLVILHFAPFLFNPIIMLLIKIVSCFFENLKLSETVGQLVIKNEY